LLYVTVLINIVQPGNGVIKSRNTQLLLGSLCQMYVVISFFTKPDAQSLSHDNEKKNKLCAGLLRMNWLSH